MYYVMNNTLFRNSELLSIKFLCAALPHMSISSYSIINLTENDFKITTYQITDSGSVETIDDTFTIHKTAVR